MDTTTGTRRTLKVAQYRTAAGYQDTQILDSDGRVIAKELASTEEAEFIVKACNAHEALVEALRKILNRYELAMMTMGQTPAGFESSPEVTNARALLAQLEAK